MCSTRPCRPAQKLRHPGQRLGEVVPRRAEIPRGLGRRRQPLHRAIEVRLVEMVLPQRLDHPGSLNEQTFDDRRRAGGRNRGPAVP